MGGRRRGRDLNGVRDPAVPCVKTPSNKPPVSYGSAVSAAARTIRSANSANKMRLGWRRDKSEPIEWRTVRKRLVNLNRLFPENVRA